MSLDLLRVIVNDNREDSFQNVKDGCNYLHYSVLYTESEKVKFKDYPDPNFLQFAIIQDKSKALKFMLRWRKPICIPGIGQKPEPQPIKEPYELKKLLDLKGTNTKLPLLHLCCYARAKNCLDVMIEFFREACSIQGTDLTFEEAINYQNYSGNTALWFAASAVADDTSFFHTLLACGADPFIPNKYQDCPMINVFDRSRPFFFEMMQNGVAKHLTPDAKMAFLGESQKFQDRLDHVDIAIKEKVEELREFITNPPQQQQQQQQGMRTVSAAAPEVPTDARCCIKCDQPALARVESGQHAGKYLCANHLQMIHR